MDIKCRKCGSANIIKNGKVFGWQRHKCKDCGYQFSKTSPAGKPVQIKLIAHELFMAGLSMRDIAKIVGVTPQSVSRWIRKWHLAYLNDMGDKETLMRAQTCNIAECLELNENDDLLISSVALPSGAKFNIVIQLPNNPQKH